MNHDERLDRLSRWVAQFDGLQNARLAPASTDASFRRYFRVYGDETLIAMDAPPPQEDCEPFVTIAAYFDQMGLNVPRVLQADIEQGFLLITDLGSTQYLAELERRPDRAPVLYDEALLALLKLQEAGSKFQSDLPPYDEELLRAELQMFQEWLCHRHLKIEFTANEKEAWRTCCNAVIDNALQQPRVFVHRDYHSRNLMLTDNNNPGILDFQDAVEGPICYDLVSLLKDCYVKWPAEFIRKKMSIFFEKQSDVQNINTFIRQFDLTGVQRHLKAAGIFARLKHRDGKTGYLKDVPRTLGYIVDIAPQYKSLHFLGELIAERILPALEDTH